MFIINKQVRKGRHVTECCMVETDISEECADFFNVGFQDGVSVFLRTC
jgi:hypothetical protein